MGAATNHLARGVAAEADDRLEDALVAYAAALDAGEPTTAEQALNAGLTFFEGKDLGVAAANAVREELFFDAERCSAWLRRADEAGSPCAKFWISYDAEIYGDGKPFPELAIQLYERGCKDALLVLINHDPARYADSVGQFVATLREPKTYRTRYLRSILSPRFDPQYKAE